MKRKQKKRTEFKCFATFLPILFKSDPTIEVRVREAN